jgi:SAM-dependent methyltransferase
VHPSAFELGRLLFQVHGTAVRRVLDVGSLDINGSLREVCPPGVDYIGIDLEAGKGVDRVLDDPYIYPFPTNYFDILVSTSCFEHDPMFWLTFLEMLRVTRDGGILYINAPSNGHYHTHPWDNWRFYPDASHALETWGRRSGYDAHALESFTMTRCGPWNDYVMVFSKGAIDLTRVPFLSDHAGDIRNLRKITEPGKMFFHTAETDDLRQINELNGRVDRLRAALLRLGEGSSGAQNG